MVMDLQPPKPSEEKTSILQRKKKEKKKTPNNNKKTKNKETKQKNKTKNSRINYRIPALCSRDLQGDATLKLINEFKNQIKPVHSINEPISCLTGEAMSAASGWPLPAVCAL